MRDSKRLASGGKRRVFVCLTIALSILILELALRVWGSFYLRLYFSPGRSRAYPEGTNILCLGDSFTYGFGVPKGYSYPEQLAGLLNSKSKDKINVSREFYINSSSLLKNLDQDIEKHNPGLIIIMTGCNDRWSLEDCDFPDPHDNFLKSLDIRLSRLHTYKLLKVCWVNLFSQFRPLGPLARLRPMGMAQNNKPVTNPITAFHNQAAREHFSSGEGYFWAGKHDLAIKEYKTAEQSEPDNPWLHFRLACVYIQALEKYDLGERHALLALSYGDSSMVEYVFMLMQYCQQKYDRQAVVNKMQRIIQERYKGEYKIKAIRYLNTLRAYNDGVWSVENVISYNLKEMLNIARQKRVKLIFMQYPFLTPWNREVIFRAGRLSGVPVVDNYLIFEEEIKKDPALKEKLFVRDGHCSVIGYGIIADNLYRNIIR